MDNGDLLIWESFYPVKPPKMISAHEYRWAEIQARAVWWDRLTKLLNERERERERGEDEFSSGSCRAAAVAALVSFPEL